MKYTPLLKSFNRPIPRCTVSDWKGGLLVRGTNWLGDCLMTIPASAQLASMLPAGTPFSVLTPAFLAPVWKACPWVTDVIAMKQKHIGAEEIRQVKDLNPGAGIVFPNSFGAALDLWKCRIPVRIGRKGRLRSLLLNHRIPEWPRGENTGVCHQLSYYLELVSALGDIRLTAECPALQVTPAPAEKFDIRKKTNILALAPGAAFGPAKQWPEKYFIEFAKYHREHGGRIVIVGTPKEKQTAAAIKTAIPDAMDLAGKTNLTELMSVLANVDAVIANDSGAMHLAAALGTPGIAIFGSTDPEATGPLGAPWQLLIADTPCRPCFRRQCPLTGKDSYRCLYSIKPEQVISEWQNLQKTLL